MLAEYLDSVVEFRSLDVQALQHRLSQAEAAPRVEQLGLIHPSVWRDSIRGPDPRGSRRFRFPASEDCEWELLTQRRCETGELSMQIDHVWPYSLGGPTEPSNARTLCTTHNELKAALLLEGTSAIPTPWLAKQLLRIMNCL